jgi:hypothetical protein
VQANDDVLDPIPRIATRIKNDFTSRFTIVLFLHRIEIFEPPGDLSKQAIARTSVEIAIAGIVKVER